MSEWGSYVVSLNEVQKHPNADRLSVVKLTDPLEGQVIINNADWEGVDRAVWILPDSVTGDNEAFDWYGRNKKTKIIKLRGLMSYGFLVPALPHHQIGDEVSKDFGVTKYEEPVKLGPPSLKGGDSAKPPKNVPTYTDIENVRNTKYSAGAFAVGEQVIVTEKLDGANARYIWADGKLHVGTHHRWLKERFADEAKHRHELSKSGWKTFWHKFGLYQPKEVESQSTWWQMARQYNLAEKLAQYPGLMFVGEVFGNRVNILKYFEEKKLELAFYDIYSTTEGRYLDWNATYNILKNVELPIAPILYKGEFTSYEELKPLAHDGTKVPGATGISEGWTIRPLVERWNEKTGRTIFKYKTDEYLSL